MAIAYSLFAIYGGERWLDSKRDRWQLLIVSLLSGLFSFLIWSWRERLELVEGHLQRLLPRIQKASARLQPKTE